LVKLGCKSSAIKKPDTSHRVINLYFMRSLYGIVLGHENLPPEPGPKHLTIDFLDSGYVSE
jgi:hypothetical protein